MSSNLPEWLSDLAPEEEEDNDVLDDVLTPSEADPGEVPEDDRLVGDLRYQMEASESERDGQSLNAGGSASIGFAGLYAWQRFVLALFLFLDVAVVGLMFLVILGKVVIPGS